MGMDRWIATRRDGSISSARRGNSVRASRRSSFHPRAIAGCIAISALQLGLVAAGFKEWSLPAAVTCGILATIRASSLIEYGLDELMVTVTIVEALCVVAGLVVYRS